MANSFEGNQQKGINYSKNIIRKIISSMIRKRKNGFTSTYSTCSNTPMQTPFKKQFTPICLSGFKQKLRTKIKQQPTQHQRIRCVRKHSSMTNMNIVGNDGSHVGRVSWIIFNMLVGIYKNWLRLAPYIIYFLNGTRKDKVEGIQRTIQNIRKQKQRIEQLLRKNKNSSIYELQRKRQMQNHDSYGDLELLDKLNEYCNQFKCNMQILNGEMLAKQKLYKIEKQNVFAQNFLEDLSNKMNFSNFTYANIDNQIVKMAETIMQRITVLKYLKKKKMNIDQFMLKPLKKLFKNSNNIYDQQQITTENIIQKIKNSFLHKNKNKQTTIRSQNKKNTHLKASEQKIKIVSSKDNRDRVKMSQKKIKGTDQAKDTETKNYVQQIANLSNYNSDQECNGIQVTQQLQNQISRKLVRTGTRKKIGFIALDQQQEQVGPNQRKRINYQFHNQRRANINRQNHKGKLNEDQDEILTSNLTSMKEINNQSSGDIYTTSIFNTNTILNNETNQILSSISNQGLNHKDKINQVLQIATTLNYLQENTNNQVSTDNKQDAEQNHNHSIRLRTRKNLKSGKLQRKKNFQKGSILHNIIDLQNFELQLQAEQNVAIKKKKIMNLLDVIENSGVIKGRSMKKIVSYAKNIQNQIKNKKSLTKENLKRQNNLTEDIPASNSFYFTPFQEDKDRKSHRCSESRPYQFLEKFHREAKQNWVSRKDKMRMFKISEIPKARFSEFDCDLNIPIIERQQNKYHEKWFKRQSKVLDLCLSFIKNFNKDTIRQKSINIQKQIIV